MQRYIIKVLVVVLLTAAAATARAQQYLFSVPQVQMTVTVNTNASVLIAYDFAFENAAGAHAIDIVDIGTPTDRYDLSNVRASIDGSQIGNIRVSSEVKPGFEVHLGAGEIGPGRSGRLHVEFTMPSMVYRDTTRAGYASLRVSPTWFGDQYVRGTTHLQIAVQLPTGVKPDEVLDQGQHFTLKAATQEGAKVGWDFQAVRLTEKHIVGLSFPSRGMTGLVVFRPLDMLLKWFGESTQARLTLGAIFMVLLAVLFFRFSGGTGFSVYAILAAAAAAVFVFSPGLHLLAMPLVVVLIGLNEWTLSRRKLHYMPPIAQIEGGGIKRGLTAPEAAVLLELPVAKALSLVIFGMLKKGVLRQMQADPLAVDVVEAFRCDTKQPPDETQQADICRQAAVKNGAVMHGYELPFLFLLQRNAGKAVRDINFSIPMKRLIEDTAARMKGFDLGQTKDYYRSIIRRAMEQAAAIGDIPQRQEVLDRNFEWILMDNGFPTVFGSGPYRPIWTRGTVFPTGGGGGGGGGTPAPSTAGTPSFGDVSASFAGWAENTMGSMAGAISPGTLSMSHPAGGFIDLSGADHVAGEFFQALSEAANSGGGGGGSGGGGCACACAGCACACACAGGGR